MEDPANLPSRAVEGPHCPSRQENRHKEQHSSRGYQEGAQAWVTPVNEDPSQEEFRVG